MVSTKAGITVGVSILILELFLLINASAIFPNGQAVTNVLMVYLILQCTVLAAFAKGLPTLSATPDMLILSLVGFLGTAFLVTIIPSAITGAFDIVSISSSVLTTSLLLFAVAYCFVKAFIEEVIFRGILMDQVGLLPQALMFGSFHFAMLSAGGASFLAVIVGAIVLTSLGIVWGKMTQAGGILLSTGSHVAWNLAAIGVLGVLL